MARSAHRTHRPEVRPVPVGARTARPWRAVLVRELRYSSAGVRIAAREGRRPVPQEVRRRVAVHFFARSDPRGGGVAADAYVAERRARQLTRRQLDRVRLGQVSDIEVEPGRHRHSARWLA
ncbi:hypothetical protein [Kitasatospora paranensis]|uniref:Uncharacterized protein n=1 Tax=Kitasatospora paranensis TaxID=258053 RepID=A0ABW2FU33_9ACTN